MPEQRYVDALLADLDAQARGLAGRTVESVFLGGGTPSLFAPASIAAVLERLRVSLALAPDAEVTLEANPATIERGRFAEYAAAGVTRVSLGAQTFDPRALQALGRIHTVADVNRSAEELHASGLSNFNLDLMFALPGQDRAGAQADLRAALALSPAHVSHYQLTLEPGTVFAAHPPALPDEEQAWQMQLDCHAELARHGFQQYEISAFARPGHQCRHNLNYWTFGDYLGVGAGAHGKLSGPLPGRVERTTQQREPRRYLAHPVEGLIRRAVPGDDLPFEFMMNALRLTGGFPLTLFTARTGLPVQVIADQLNQLRDRGLLDSTQEHWRPTALGLQFLNDAIAAFLGGPNSQAGAQS